MLGGIATPLVVSVHSIVSSDFAIANLPGWHSLIFPPYFVAGAIYSGFAMVLTLMIPARRLYRIEHVITTRHLDSMAKMLLVTGWIVLYSYVVEAWSAWYSGDRYEIYTNLVMRPFGPYALVYWVVIIVQLRDAAALLVAAREAKRARALDRLALHPDRHVGRALHAHRHVAEP